MAKEKIEPELVEHSGLGRVKLDFSPSNQSFKVPPGVSVFDAASWNGIAIDSTCGGHGTCKKCKVQITEGIVPISRLDIRAFSQEELKNGWRLACVARATENLAITVPAMTTRPKAATVGVGRQVILRPAVQKRYLELTEPTLHDQRPDIQRVTDGIDDLEVSVEFEVLQKLPTILRKNNFNIFFSLKRIKFQMHSLRKDGVGADQNYGILTKYVIIDVYEKRGRDERIPVCICQF